MNAWESTRATPEHLTKIGELAESHYGIKDDTAHPDYLAHEYYKNPNGDALVQIAWNEEKKEAGGSLLLFHARLKLALRLSLC